MRNFVAYHKVADWGPYDDLDIQGKFEHFSNHPQRELEQMIGQTVWVIAGDRQNGQMQYTLCAVYEPSEIAPVPDGGFIVIGQGLFRTQLLTYWGACAVTGIRVVEALRASHIKPWACSANQERLDPFNGLLLVGTLDLLFDAGLISFDDIGRIMICDTLPLADRESLGLNESMQLRRTAPEHLPYLAFHRENVFHNR